MVGFCRQKSSAEKVTFGVFTGNPPVNRLASLISATVSRAAIPSSST
jgi:hypothetical protein